MTLRDLIKDCGGSSAVAQALGCTPQNVHKMIQRGHLPFSELNGRGRKRYSEKLAAMQNKGSLTAAEIRRIGFRV